MSLPPLIEIMPLKEPIRAEVSVPGSKSVTNRTLVLAALGEGFTVLRGALWSEDTRVMVECLRQLGFEVEVTADPQEPSNRTLTVRGGGGEIPVAGAWNAPLSLFVGNAGTAARFLTAMTCLGRGRYRLEGTPRMHERPQQALFSALRELGYCLDSSNDRLPVVVHATGRRAATCCVSLNESSQFASALLLCAPAGGWQIRVVGDNLEQSPYVAMTRRLIQQFRLVSGEFLVEIDTSSASYFVAADFLQQTAFQVPSMIRVRDWPTTDWQVDSRFPEYLPLPASLSRANDLGDSIMTAVVLAPFAEREVTFTDLGRLRVQECERVKALRTELVRCKAKVKEKDDTLIVQPSSLRGAEIETYEDHRVAMCFSILGLKVPGMKIKNPACVKKTFPNFFQKLAAPPPEGLGVTITDPATQKVVPFEDLLAE